MNQLAWHTGHLALFRRHLGVHSGCGSIISRRAWLRPGRPLSSIAATASSPASAVSRSIPAGLPRAATRQGRSAASGSSKRASAICSRPTGRRSTRSLDALQAGLDERSALLARRLKCPVTGTSIEEAFAGERLVLQPLPRTADPFDIVVTRRVHRECLVSFEGRRFSVPFAWVGRDVEVWGVHGHVVIRGMGAEIARHPRHTKELLVLDPAHYEGDSRRTASSGRHRWARERGSSSPDSRGASRSALLHLPAAEHVQRSLDAYLRIVEATR